MALADNTSITVASGEAKIIQPDTSLALMTFDLQSDIAVTCYNPATRSTGLARTTDMGVLEPFFRTIVESEYTNPEPVCKVRLVGGDGNIGTQDFLRQLLRLLDGMDNGRDIISIVSSAIGNVPHPESFRITCYDGKIGQIPK